MADTVKCGRCHTNNTVGTVTCRRCKETIDSTIKIVEDRHPPMSWPRAPIRDPDRGKPEPRTSRVRFGVKEVPTPAPIKPLPPKPPPAGAMTKRLLRSPSTPDSPPGSVPSGSVSAPLPFVAPVRPKSFPAPFPPPKSFPPSPPPEPVYSRPVSPASTGPRAGKVLALLAGFGVLLWLVIGLGPSLLKEVQKQASTTTSAPGTASTPCPAEVASYLPGGTGTLVAGYASDTHDILICKDLSGQLYYDGRERGVVVTADNHITLPANVTSAGYQARNLGFVYEISGEVLVVTNEGAEVARMILTPR